MKYLYSSVLKILCVVIMVFHAINAQASGPCDLFCSDRNEWWPSKQKTYLGKIIEPQQHSRNTHCLCPPYNKTAGRKGCLLRNGLPDPFNVFHTDICAEESPESNYFTPKIRYRAQMCNIACWTLKGDLAGAGECTVIPTPYGMPLIRLCARMAMPADPANDKKADQGYVVDKHLDFEGYWVDDNPISNGGYDADGKPQKTPDPLLQVPKICMYWDPSLLDTLLSYALANYYVMALTPVIVGLAATDNGINIQNVFDGLLDIDFMDYKPEHQSRHNSDGIDPVVQMIIDFAKNAGKFANSVTDIGDKIKDTIDPTSKMISYAAAQVGLSDKLTKSAKDVADFTQYSTQWMLQMKWILKAAIWIVENVGVEMLKFFGTLNRVVSMSFGCVNVPIGPMPPPYCPTLPLQLSFPTISPICSTIAWNDGTAMLQQSSSSDPCNNSDITCTIPIPFGLCMTPFVNGERNNAIHNSIRVGFSDNKPLCTEESLGDNNATLSGKCVNINGSLNASLLRSRNDKKGTIKLCSQIPAAAGETPCVESAYLLAQHTGQVLPEYRLLYSIGSIGTPTEYFDESLPDCIGIANSCQMVWGVNIGSFADLSVSFQNDDNADPKWSNSVTLLDSSKVSHVFKAAITRTEQKIDEKALSDQESDQICVYEVKGNNNTIIGCQTRAIAPKPKVRECSSGICTSSFFTPRMIAKLEVPNTNGSDFTETVVGVDSNVTYNLAGYNYQAYATDNTFSKKPFSGSHAILNGASIYGNYIGGIAPYNINRVQNPEAVYLNGLEYLDDQYQRGVKYLCLTGYQADDCLSGKTRQNCVLSKLLNSDVISCTSFASILGKYRGIEVCDVGNADLVCNYAQPKESFDGKNNAKIKIIPCVSNATGASSDCYDYGLANGPLCEASEKGVDRLIPPTTSDLLPNGSVPNIDYYDYLPGVLSNVDSNKFDNINANARIVLDVQSKAQEIASLPVDYKYTQGVCTSNPTFVEGVDVSYNNLMTSCAADHPGGGGVSLSVCTSDPEFKTMSYDMMEACTNARNSSDKINAICTQTLALVTNHASTLYSQLLNICDATKANMTNILQDQFNAQLLSQMQSDTVSSAQEISNLMNVINNLSTVPSLVTNIIKTEQNIYSSNDVVLYPTIVSKIAAICTQTKALIPNRLLAPTIYDALNSACTTATAGASQGALDALDSTINGFTQYNIASENNVNPGEPQTPAPGDYIPPDFNTMKVRNRSALENGLCVAVPQPSCDAVSTATAGTGYATWTSAGMGEKSIGTCMTDTTAKTPTSLERYCLLDGTTNTTSLEPISPTIGCETKKCIITFGTATADRVQGSQNFRNGMANPQSWTYVYQSNPPVTCTGSYSATGPDENGDYTISFETNDFKHTVWADDAWIDIPITFVAGSGVPTVKFSTTLGRPKYYELNTTSQTNRYTPTYISESPRTLNKSGYNAQHNFQFKAGTNANKFRVYFDTDGGGYHGLNNQPLTGVGNFTIKVNCNDL